MLINRVKKTMTSFKLSDATRTQIARIRDTRNSKFGDYILGNRLTNTDVIRQLVIEECARLDELGKEQAAKVAVKEKTASKAKSKSKTTKKR